MLLRGLLLSFNLLKNIKKVSALDTDWKKKLSNKLSKDGSATVICPIESREILQDVLNFLIIEPVETDYIKAYARLVGIKRDKENRK